MSTSAATPPALPTAVCRNCGHSAPGRFCPACGQGTADRRVSLRRLVVDALEDEFSVSSALPRTLRLLLLRPGALTREYLAGRRARYIPPLRLYLLASFAFFLVITLGRGFTVMQVRTDGGTSTEAVREGAVQIDASADELEQFENTRLPFMTEEMQRRFSRRLRRLMEAEPGDVNRLVMRAFADRAPVAVFLLVPVFAALLMATHHGAHRFYVEHFVFALHLHAFVFLVGTLRSLLGAWTWLAQLLLLWVVVHLVLAIRNVYEQSLARTLLKFAVVMPAYFAILGVTMLALLLFAIATVPL